MHEPPDRSRLIRLRRPPRIARVDERFVPQVPLDEVDRRWAALRGGNPRYFDGDILHVLGAHRDGHGGVTIHVAPTSYRFYAVQRPTEGGFDCGIRPLGAKALAVAGGRLLMGRRSDSVAYYPGEWEFVPGGGLEPDDDPASCVLRELAEETEFAAASSPVAVALLYDPGAVSWEVVHRLAVRSRTADNLAASSSRWEHDDRRLVSPLDWPQPLCRVARAMLPLAIEAITSADA